MNLNKNYGSILPHLNSILVSVYLPISIFEKENIR